MTIYKDQKEMDKAVQSTDLSEFALQVDEKEKKKLQFDIISVKNKKDLHQFKFDTEKELLTWLTTFELIMGGNVAPTGGAASGSDANKLFGAPLEKACVDGRDVPYIVEHCIKYIDEKGSFYKEPTTSHSSPLIVRFLALTVEGIFRLSGSQVTIDKYRDQFNQGMPLSSTFHSPV